MQSVVEAQNAFYGEGKGPPLLTHGEGDRFRKQSKQETQQQKVEGDENSDVKNVKMRITSLSLLSSLSTKTNTSAEISDEERDRLREMFPASELPAGFPPELAFRALAAYSTIRTLSIALRLSPFTPNVFLRALYLRFPNRLLGQIHVALLRILLPALQMGYHWPVPQKNGEGSKSKHPPPLHVSKKRKYDGVRWPLRAGDNLEFMDPYTWPIFCDDYAHLVADIHHASWSDANDYSDMKNLDLSMVQSDTVGIDGELASQHQISHSQSARPSILYLNGDASSSEEEDDPEEFKPSTRLRDDVSSSDSDGSYGGPSKRKVRRGRGRPRKVRRRMSSDESSSDAHAQQRPGKRQKVHGASASDTKVATVGAVVVAPPHAEQTVTMQCKLNSFGKLGAAPGKRRLSSREEGSFPPIYLSPGRKVAQPSPFLPFSANGYHQTRGPGTHHHQILGVVEHPQNALGRLGPFGWSQTRQLASAYVHGTADTSFRMNDINTPYHQMLALPNSAQLATACVAKQNSVQKDGTVGCLATDDLLSNPHAVTGPLLPGREFGGSHARTDEVGRDPASFAQTDQRNVGTAAVAAAAEKVPNGTTGTRNGAAASVTDACSLVEDYLRVTSNLNRTLNRQAANLTHDGEKTDEVEAARLPRSEGHSVAKRRYRPIDDAEKASIWSHFSVLKCMRSGVPYHCLEVEQKLDLLEFLIDDLLSLDVFAAEMARREEVNGFLEQPYGSLPQARELSGLVNNDECAVCGKAGDLLCCDGCVWSYHRECVAMARNAQLPDGSWYCPECSIADSSKYGPLHGGRKSGLDWFSVGASQQILKKSGVENQGQSSGVTCREDTEFLVIHGFVFRRRCRRPEDFRLSPEVPLNIKELRATFVEIGRNSSLSWPLIHVPCDRGLVWGQTAEQRSRSYLANAESYDPSAYKSSYRLAPLEGTLRRVKDAFLATYEQQCYAAPTQTISSRLVGRLDRDDMVARELARDPDGDFGLQLVRGYLASLERNLCKSCLLEESWGIVPTGPSWVSRVNQCGSVAELSQLVLVLVDAAHTRVFYDGWYRCPTAKQARGYASEASLRLSAGLPAESLLKKRNWERCGIGQVRGLLAADGKRLVDWLAELRPDSSTRQRASKRKDKENGSSPGRTARVDRGACFLPVEKLSAAGNSGNGKPLVCVEAEPPPQHGADNPKAGRGRQLRRSTRGGAVYGDGVALVESVDESAVEKSVSKAMQNVLESAAVSVHDVFSAAQFWPAAGRGLYDPLGRLPPRVVRRLARRGGGVHAADVEYSAQHEVGQVCYFHIWRKRVLSCGNIEELLLLMRLMASFVDLTTVSRAANLVRHLNKSQPDISRVVCTQYDIKDGDEYYLVRDLQSRARWTSHRDVDLEALIAHRYRRRQRFIEAHKQCAKSNAPQLADASKPAQRQSRVPSQSMVQSKFVSDSQPHKSPSNGKKIQSAFAMSDTAPPARGNVKEDAIEQYNDVLLDHQIAYTELVSVGEVNDVKVQALRQASFRRLERLLTSLGSSVDKSRIMKTIVIAEASNDALTFGDAGFDDSANNSSQRGDQPERAKPKLEKSDLYKLQKKQAKPQSKPTLGPLSSHLRPPKQSRGDGGHSSAPLLNSGQSGHENERDNSAVSCGPVARMKPTSTWPTKPLLDARQTATLLNMGQETAPQDTSEQAKRRCAESLVEARDRSLIPQATQKLPPVQPMPETSEQSDRQSKMSAVSQALETLGTSGQVMPSLPQAAAHQQTLPGLAQPSHQHVLPPFARATHQALPAFAPTAHQPWSMEQPSVLAGGQFPTLASLQPHGAKQQLDTWGSNSAALQNLNTQLNQGLSMQAQAQRPPNATGLSGSQQACNPLNSQHELAQVATDRNGEPAEHKSQDQSNERYMMGLVEQALRLHKAKGSEESKAQNSTMCGTESHASDSARINPVGAGRVGLGGRVSTHQSNDFCLDAMGNGVKTGLSRPEADCVGEATEAPPPSQRMPPHNLNTNHSSGDIQSTIDLVEQRIAALDSLARGQSASTSQPVVGQQSFGYGASAPFLQQHQLEQYRSLQNPQLNAWGLALSGMNGSQTGNAHPQSPHLPDQTQVGHGNYLPTAQPPQFSNGGLYGLNGSSLHQPPATGLQLGAQLLGVGDQPGPPLIQATANQHQRPQQNDLSYQQHSEENQWMGSPPPANGGQTEFNWNGFH